MRSIFIQTPLEFRLDVPGDTLTQGAEVAAHLTVKNHGAVAASLPELSLRLALGNQKKVKAKDSGAFQVLSEGELERGTEVPPGGELSFSHTFRLDKNSPISDKSKSITKV